MNELSAAESVTRNGEEDECTTCGGSGYLDLTRKMVCPNCQGTGRVTVYVPESA
jgi:DnaJ-class molecular chaperone